MAYIPLTNAGEQVVRPPPPITFRLPYSKSAPLVFAAGFPLSGGLPSLRLWRGGDLSKGLESRGRCGANADSITVGNAPSAPGPFRSYPAIGISFFFFRSFYFVFLTRK